ncbi:hypothetical protein KIV56_15555 [Cryobacterium breve]|uniref:Uncharacterized protein n=1 Tax=Cryobacterium breve TaxID=1259258 RepID=A0ABY7NAZ6_9MICO|nr:hypothetical protein [Cryobacterium breve]WBM79665.1 hypothetical protein KIV56_15555 [Cryobacterium breve]
MVVLAVVAVVCVGLPIAFTTGGTAVTRALVPDSTSSLARLSDELSTIPGVASVGDAHSSAGDLSFRNNGFLTVTAAPGLTDTAVGHLAGHVSQALATVQLGSDSRLMVRLDVDRLNVAISQEAALNEPRLRLARLVLALDGVSRVTVSWREQGDDLIFDTSNVNLDVTVISSGLPAVELAARSVRVARTVLADASVTTTLPGPTLRADAYTPDRIPDDGSNGSRTVLLESVGSSLTGALALATALDSRNDIVGYSVSGTYAQIVFRAGTDPALAVAQLDLSHWAGVRAFVEGDPVEWSFHDHS